MNFKTKWDLQKHFYQDLSDPQFEKDIKDGVKRIKIFVDKYRSKGISKLNDKDFLKFLQEEDEDNLILKAAYYLSYRSALNTQDQAVIKKQAELGNIFTELQTESLFFDEEFKRIGAQELLRRSELPEYSEFKNYLVDKARSLKFNLDEETEKALLIMDQGSPTSLMNIYDELTNSFVFHVELDGEIQELTLEEVRSLRENPDPDIRRKAFEALRKVFGSKQNQIVLGNIYKGIVKDCIGDKKLRKIPSVMFDRNDSEQLSDEVVDLLIETVRKAFPLYHKYLTLKAQVLKLEKMNAYDIFAPTSGEEKELNFEKGLEKFLEIISEFDKEFYEYSKEMFEEGRVDVYPQKGKMGGAFANYSKGLPSFVLLNYTNKFSDMMTLAHELGHAFHGFLSQDQPQTSYHSPLCLAETASIFTETYVFEKILSDSTLTKEEKTHYLFERLSDIFSTAFRQIQYILFERKIHEGFDTGQEMTYEDFNLIWRETQKELFGENYDFVVAAEEEFGWSWISHIFHTPFYCYTYSFGNLLSLALYKEYKEKGEEFVEKFKNILKAGGSERPEQLLAKNDVHINEDFFKNGIQIIEDYLLELEKMLKKE